jgi:hypothetical protein
MFSKCAFYHFAYRSYLDVRYLQTYILLPTLHTARQHITRIYKILPPVFR